MNGKARIKSSSGTDVKSARMAPLKRSNNKPKAAYMAKNANQTNAEWLPPSAMPRKISVKLVPYMTAAMITSADSQAGTATNPTGRNPGKAPPPNGDSKVCCKAAPNG